MASGNQVATLVDRLVAAPAELRGAAAHLANSVAMVIAMSEGEPLAVTASSVAIASREPPLLTVAFKAGSRMQRALAGDSAVAFTVSILRDDDHVLARRFAIPGRAAGWQSLAGIRLVQRDAEPPLLVNAAAWFACRVRQVVPLGDHDLVVGDILGCGRDPAARPLLHHRGRFHALGSPVAPADWALPERGEFVANW
ncbi:MAG: flavin reductase family protein [Thermomicrobiales bacterium]